MKPTTKAATAAGQDVKEILHKIFDEKMLPQDAMGLNEEMMNGIYAQAHTLYNSGRYQMASQVFRLLITLNPTVYKYVLGLAASQHMMKDYVNAILSYQICSMMDVNNPVAQYHTSDCLLKLNDPAAAIVSLETAIKVAGNQPEFKMLVDRCKMTLDSLKQGAV